METSLFGLLQCAGHQVLVQPSDLDIHLQGGNPILRACNLEIHISKMVLGAQNVRQNSGLVSFLDESHGDSGDRILDGDPGVHQ